MASTTSEGGGIVNTAIGMALLAVGARSLKPSPPSPFYDAPEVVPDQPGTLIRSEPADFYLDPFKLVRAPADVTRIMFSTRDRHGTSIAVTGTVLTPTRPRRKRADRGLVVFAVGTQGMGSQCAPSRQMAVGREYESLFITGLLTRGYNVVVPDYQGLGMAGVHTYMSRDVQGHVVLDALRAAQDLGHPDIPVDGPVAITGYSQGGGAAAAASEMWHEYAPELKVIGAVAGAVPGDLALTATGLDGGPYFGFLMYAISGFISDYEIDASLILNEKGQQLAADIKEQCLFESIRRYAFTKSSSLTIDGSSAADLLGAEPFRSIVAEQSLGSNGRWPRMPMLVIHSRMDDVIPFEAGRSLAETWVGNGAFVRLSTNHAPTHAAAALTSYGAAFAFLNARFAGRPMRGNTARYLRKVRDEE